MLPMESLVTAHIHPRLSSLSSRTLALASKSDRCYSALTAVRGVGSTHSGHGTGLGLLQTSLSGSVCLERQHALQKFLFPTQRRRSTGHRCVSARLAAQDAPGGGPSITPKAPASVGLAPEQLSLSAGEPSPRVVFTIQNAQASSIRSLYD